MKTERRSMATVGRTTLVALAMFVVTLMLGPGVKADACDQVCIDYLETPEGQEKADEECDGRTWEYYFCTFIGGNKVRCTILCHAEEPGGDDEEVELEVGGSN